VNQLIPNATLGALRYYMTDDDIKRAENCNWNAPIELDHLTGLWWLLERPRIEMLRYSFWRSPVLVMRKR
jgi:hypothetical protein